MRLIPREAVFQLRQGIGYYPDDVGVNVDFYMPYKETLNKHPGEKSKESDVCQQPGVGHVKVSRIVASAGFQRSNLSTLVLILPVDSTLFKQRTWWVIHRVLFDHKK